MKNYLQHIIEARNDTIHVKCMVLNIIFFFYKLNILRLLKLNLRFYFDPTKKCTFYRGVMLYDCYQNVNVHTVRVQITL